MTAPLTTRSTPLHRMSLLDLFDLEATAHAKSVSCEDVAERGYHAAQYEAAGREIDRRAGK